MLFPRLQPVERFGAKRQEKETRRKGCGRVSGAERRLRRSGRMWRLLFHHVFCLRPFLALHDFKFDVIALLQAFVALRLDGAVVDEHIGAVFPTDEAETLCVIEPFHFSFDSRHILTPSVLGHRHFPV